MKVDLRRVHILHDAPSTNEGPVIYWMSRDQRVYDNWALLYAQQKALELKKPLWIVFLLQDDFPGANLRHFDFMFKGLQEIESELKKYSIPFFLLKGEIKNLQRFLMNHKVSLTVTDFSPLKMKTMWISKLLEKISCPLHEVDAHNIVPCRFASQKKEFGAYTLRPKIKKKLDDFLTPFPKLKKHPYTRSSQVKKTDWSRELKKLKIDRSVLPVSFPHPGEKKAKNQLTLFIKKHLFQYSEKKNIPYVPSTSRLSAYLHFGHLSSQRVAQEIMKASNKDKALRHSSETYLEELIIRKELSDNFCFYSEDYTSLESFPNWAKQTLSAHKHDKRDFLYSFKELEEARTHDELWNAAQNEMRFSGHMHGYMRMYWAKKILEWTRSPEEAFKFALSLNDKYLLDGRDPNGYTGIAWSIGGVHDRAWGERKIFGKIRYMAQSGCKNKFDIKAYIKMVQNLKLLS